MTYQDTYEEICDYSPADLASVTEQYWHQLSDDLGRELIKEAEVAAYWRDLPHDEFIREDVVRMIESDLELFNKGIICQLQEQLAALILDERLFGEETY